MKQLKKDAVMCFDSVMCILEE